MWAAKEGHVSELLALLVGGANRSVRDKVGVHNIWGIGRLVVNLTAVNLFLLGRQNRLRPGPDL
jgi:hypothetical protein